MTENDGGCGVSSLLIITFQQGCKLWNRRSEYMKAMTMISRCSNLNKEHLEGVCFISLCGSYLVVKCEPPPQSSVQWTRLFMVHLHLTITHTTLWTWFSFVTSHYSSLLLASHCLLIGDLVWCILFTVDKIPKSAMITAVPKQFRMSMWVISLYN